MHLVVCPSMSAFWTGIPRVWLVPVQFIYLFYTTVRLTPLQFQLLAFLLHSDASLILYKPRSYLSLNRSLYPYKPQSYSHSDHYLPHTSVGLTFISSLNMSLTSNTALRLTAYNLPTYPPLWNLYLLLYKPWSYLYTIIRLTLFKMLSYCIQTPYLLCLSTIQSHTYLRTNPVAVLEVRYSGHHFSRLMRAGSWHSHAEHPAHLKREDWKAALNRTARAQ